MGSFFWSTNLLRWALSLLLMPAATASGINSNRIDQKHLPAWTNTAGEFGRTKSNWKSRVHPIGFLLLASNQDSPWPKTSGQGCSGAMLKT
jgi:hypothetical protein